jgi:hypothetical protein
MRHVVLRVVTILYFFAFGGSITAQLKQAQLGRGDEWLSFRPEQRQTYVYGFIDGYLEGTLSSCDLANELFEKGRSHTLGDGHHRSDMPTARCLVHRGEFSKLFSDMKHDTGGHMDVAIYTDVITDFYERHGNCREYPFGFLMEELSLKYSTADQLYEAASHGLLKGRSRQWCGLSNSSAKQ